MNEFTTVTEHTYAYNQTNQPMNYVYVNKLANKVCASDFLSQGKMNSVKSCEDV